MKAMVFALTAAHNIKEQHMKTVIEMARSTGATAYTNRHYPDRPTHTFNVDQLQAFAELVRADMKERCAKMCDQLALEDGLHQAKYCANAIRGRMDE